MNQVQRTVKDLLLLEEILNALAATSKAKKEEKGACNAIEDLDGKEHDNATHSLDEIDRAVAEYIESFAPWRRLSEVHSDELRWLKVVKAHNALHYLKTF